jgi:DNA repair protein RecO (recombination protein O)
MGVAETEAIILRTYKLAEADKIAVFLSQHSGVMRGVARGARRLKSKFGAALEPFTLVSLSYFEKEGQELVSIRQADILRSYFEFSRNAEIIATLEYLGGLILEFAPPHEPNEKVFRMFKACLEAISLAPEHLQQVARYCEVWLLKLSGFLPDLRACSTCRKSFAGTTSAAYLGIDGNLRCSACAHNSDIYLSGDANTQLRASQRLKPSDWARTSSLAPESSLKEVSSVTQHLITRSLERLPRGKFTFK